MCVFNNKWMSARWAMITPREVHGNWKILKIHKFHLCYLRSMLGHCLLKGMVDESLCYLADCFLSLSLLLFNACTNVTCTYVMTELCRTYCVTLAFCICLLTLNSCLSFPVSQQQSHLLNVCWMNAWTPWRPRLTSGPLFCTESDCHGYHHLWDCNLYEGRD